MKSPIEILESRGWVENENHCWILNGCRFSNGYAQVKVAGTPRGAHRVSYEVFNGPIPNGMVVRHKCDVKACINPAHLETGTVQDNVDDRNSRGRTARGNRGVGKFTDDEVRTIRSEVINDGWRANYTELAIKYGVSYGTIQKIYLRKGYAHVDS